MRKILLVFVTVLITASGFAQKTADIGIWGGTSNYYGDLDKVTSFQSFNPNFGAFFRYNFNARVGLRAMFMTGNFADIGEIERVPWEFDKNIQDLSLQIEINYLKYILGEKKTPFTSYITAGIGVAYFPYDMDPGLIALVNGEHNKGDAIINESVIATTIPFGFGFKYNLGRRVGVGVEYQVRKIFSDKLDNLDDPLAFIDEESIENTYNGNMHNSDWSGYLGVHVTYMIYMGKNACPVYDRKQK
jgi:hypothetical protein